MKRAMSLVLAAAMAFSFAACGGASSTSGAASTASGAAIKIGGIGPLTGGAAIYGNAVKNGTELAVEEINAQGGLQFELNFQDDENDPEKSLNAYNNLAIYGNAVKNGTELAVEEINAQGGLQFELNFQDDENDPEKSLNAYNNLKDWGMQALLGTVTTQPCLTVAPETAADNMFLLTPSASAADKDWGMQALLGTVTTQPCLTVAPETAADNMFLLTPSASAADVIKADNAFQVCFTDPNQGVASADYIADNGLATKIAIIYDSSDAYSSGVHDKFKEEAATKGLEIVADEAFTADNKTDFSTKIAIIYDSSDAYSSGVHDKFKEEAATKGLEIVADEAFTADNKTDFSVQVQKAKSSGAELVFLPIYYSEANLIIQEMNKQGCTASVFGCDGLDGLLTIEGADTSLFEGVMLLTPFAADAQDEKTQNFVSKYEEKYGETPNQFAADAYDGVYAILAACEQGGVTADMDASAVCDALKAAMTQISVDGLTGEGMKWEATGEVNKAPRAVKIQNGAYTAM